MKMRLNISLFIVFLLFISEKAFAQKTVSSEIKTKIYCSHCDQCETCGKRFDQELYKLKGLKSFTVIPSTNTIKVSYNPKKISLDKIRVCIANCGYDADDVKATESGLNNLDGCCRKQE